jgi:AMMECR1 domain-containing protein
MKSIFYFLLFITFSLSYAQETGTIKGKILDGELFNEPLLMASVTLKNTELNTNTNFNGNFEIENIQPGQYNLIVAFLGYEGLELPVTVVAGEQLDVFETLHAKTLAIPSITAMSSLKESTFEAEAKSAQRR